MKKNIIFFIFLALLMLASLACKAISTQAEVPPTIVPNVIYLTTNPNFEKVGLPGMELEIRLVETWTEEGKNFVRFEVKNENGIQTYEVNEGWCWELETEGGYDVCYMIDSQGVPWLEITNPPPFREQF